MGNKQQRAAKKAATKESEAEAPLEQEAPPQKSGKKRVVAGQRVGVALARQYASLRAQCGDKDDSLVGCALLNEQIDQWEVTYRYPEFKTHVRLRLVFSLAEADMPPKVTIEEAPPALTYICFEELGASAWHKGTDLATLVLSLRYAVGELVNGGGDTQKHTREYAEERWNYVKNAHSNWEMPDTEALNAGLAHDVVKAARTEALAELSAAPEAVAVK
eukprot:TRINITY_DN5127_c0_g1_i1.p2 TRINITY_DN5127_c0_g1~~TRINITY_DN5127_c0_g1_i1.p2  ORF type:complete len:218 (-),score=92.34 TRINITY_DN5127_c0_g1_i1:65-718(-)